MLHVVGDKEAHFFVLFFTILQVFIQTPYSQQYATTWQVWVLAEKRPLAPAYWECHCALVLWMLVVQAPGITDKFTTDGMIDTQKCHNRMETHEWDIPVCRCDHNRHPIDYATSTNDREPLASERQVLQPSLCNRDKVLTFSKSVFKPHIQ